MTIKTNKRPTPMQRLSSQITTARMTKDISQQRLADISGISLRTIKNLEMGRGNPSLETIEILFRTLGLKSIEL